jgi:dTMP kinase
MSRADAFITLEGGEGVGKSTQAGLLVDRLDGLGADVERVREPGGTDVGDRLREILLAVDAAHPVPRAELLLYEASRAQLVDEVIAPRLAEGAFVVCDRFIDSTLAYQGYGRGLGAEWVGTLNLWAAGGLLPDLTVVLDVDPATGIERATSGGADRLEGEDAAFHGAVREGFLAIAGAEPDRVKVVDASGTVDEVAARVWTHISALDAVRGLVDG